MNIALKKLRSLGKNERNYVLLELLVNNEIDFTEVSSLYVESLKVKNKGQQVIISGLAFPAISYFDGTKPDIFMKAKAAYNLLKSKVFHTAQCEKELKAFVKKHKYSEDENGYRIIKK